MEAAADHGDMGRETPTGLLIEADLAFPEPCEGAVLVDDELAGVDAGDRVVGKLAHRHGSLG